MRARMLFTVTTSAAAEMGFVCERVRALRSICLRAEHLSIFYALILFDLLHSCERPRAKTHSNEKTFLVFQACLVAFRLAATEHHTQPSSRVRMLISYTSIRHIHRRQAGRQAGTYKVA